MEGKWNFIELGIIGGKMSIKSLVYITFAYKTVLFFLFYNKLDPPFSPKPLCLASQRNFPPISLSLPSFFSVL